MQGQKDSSIILHKNSSIILKIIITIRYKNRAVTGQLKSLPGNNKSSPWVF